ncbi:MAG: glycogen debranching protein [Fusobacteriaceae bacterium]
MNRMLKGEALLGANVKSEGINFGIYSKNGTGVVLNIFKDELENEPIQSYKLIPEHNRTGDIWHCFIPSLSGEVFYTWKIDGPSNFSKGHRFNKEVHLLDPYAKIYTENKNGVIRKAVALDTSFLEEEVKRLNHSIGDMIVYEMHVSLFTKSKTCKIKNKGTYAGLIENIEHLKKLGVTTVELLPIQEFDETSAGKNPITEEKLTNVWGYNTIGFFATSSKYSSFSNSYKEKLKEFRKMVDSFHKAGIEVILDVVYNHTAEGNENGPVLNFKGMDNTIFYILEKNKTYYTNYSGTGNTLNCNHPAVKTMILDSLRYWYSMMGVDGFRFDLGTILGRGSNGEWLKEHNLLQDIAEDPILSRAKFFTEPWDASGGYYPKEFPKNFSVWNDKFRDVVRGFIKGDSGMVGELVKRVGGSPDIFNGEKNSSNSLNFITAHDGFTMWDLVSYNQKNNIANGENNRDGENNNRSWNHGLEGPTSCSRIFDLRKKQIKNMINILILSKGIPMILMGDEIGKTQLGNNNTYCQDNEMNYLNWDRENEFEDINFYFSELIKFRKIHKSLKRSESIGQENKITIHGIKSEFPDLSYYSHSIGFMFQYDKNAEIYAGFNSYHQPLDFELPTIHGKEWHLVSDTSRKGKKSFLEETEIICDGKYTIESRSSIIAIAKNIITKS